VTENNTERRGSFRIDADVYDAVVREQERLRKLRHGKKPTYSEILRDMWTAYQAILKHAPHSSAEINDVAATARNDEERRYVIGLLGTMRDTRIWHDYYQPVVEILFREHLPPNKPKAKHGAA
jgi:hypothetical protein